MPCQKEASSIWQTEKGLIQLIIKCRRNVNLTEGLKRSNTLLTNTPCIACRSLNPEWNETLHVPYEPCGTGVGLGGGGPGAATAPREELNVRTPTAIIYLILRSAGRGTPVLKPLFWSVAGPGGAAVVFLFSSLLLSSLKLSDTSLSALNTSPPWHRCTFL